MSLSSEEVRKRILIGLFSDDELLDRLVLKGGNALEMIYALANRASFDMDFSMEERFEDLGDARRRIQAALEREFARIDLVVFDLSIEEKPDKRRADTPPWWVGYLVNFKLVQRAIYDRHQGEIEAIRRNAEIVGPSNRRTYKVDISAYEFCRTKQRQEIDHYTLYVYSLEMIVIEKLRAICQQMSSYPYRTTTSTPRSRDFYDIHQIMSVREINLASEENAELAKNIFSAKHVPLTLLRQVRNEKDFHCSDWERLTLSVRGEVEPFDYYFEFVLRLIEKLEHAWKI